MGILFGINNPHEIRTRPLSPGGWPRCYLISDNIISGSLNAVESESRVVSVTSGIVLSVWELWRGPFLARIFWNLQSLRTLFVVGASLTVRITSCFISGVLLNISMIVIQDNIQLLTVTNASVNGHGCFTRLDDSEYAFRPHSTCTWGDLPNTPQSIAFFGLLRVIS